MKKVDLVIPYDTLYEIYKAVKAYNTNFKTAMGEVVVFSLHELLERNCLTYFNAMVFVSNLCDIVVTNNKFDKNLKALLHALHSRIFEEGEEKFGELNN